MPETAQEQKVGKRAVLYGWDRDPADEVFGANAQELAENIGSAIHQMLEFDGDTSEIRVQILDDVMTCHICGTTAPPKTETWQERDVSGSGGDFVQFRCPKCTQKAAADA